MFEVGESRIDLFNKLSTGVNIIFLVNIHVVVFIIGKINIQNVEYFVVNLFINFFRYRYEPINE